MNRIIVSSLLTLAGFSQALAHGGIYFYDLGGQPILGWNNSSTGLIDPFNRVALTNWSWHTPTGAFSASSPSWSMKPRAGDLISFKFLTSLQRWDDTTGTFVDAAQDVRVTYTISGNSYAALSHATGAAPGFQFAMAADTTPDYWHLRHSLHGVAQDDPTATGLYRMNYEVTRTFVTAVSDPVMGSYSAGTAVVYPGFGMLFNRGVTDTAVVSRAQSYAIANPVPEPASLAALSLGVVALLKRRRKGA